VKIRILLLMLAGAAGLGSSYALANDGDGHHGHDQATTTGSCQRGELRGTAAAPQTFVVTVTKSGEHSSLAPGQVVTVTVGSSGQTLRVGVEGCVNGSSVAAREAELHVARSTTADTTTTGTTTTETANSGATTTGATTTGATTTGTTTTTSTSHVVGSGRHDGRHHRH
jgi:hypothetical protein